MRVLVAAVLLLVGAAACQRQVEVGTEPAGPVELALVVDNNLSQPVNVYLIQAGQELFLRQVGANTTERIPVTGVATGATVDLRARTADNTRVYSRENVTLQGVYQWEVP